MSAKIRVPCRGGASRRDEARLAPGVSPGYRAKRERTLKGCQKSRSREDPFSRPFRADDVWGWEPRVGTRGYPKFDS